jgi:L-ascorbate metabolism protein UlaG (beta-lactamase superfamily)
MCGPYSNAQEVTFQWFGQGCFLLKTSQNTQIIVDPMQMGGYQIPTEIKADIVTVSHEHGDHNKVDAVSGSPIVLRGLSGEAIDRKIKDVRIYTVDSFHDDTQGSQRGKNAIFVYEFDGIRVAHLGDLGHVLTSAQVQKIGAIDVLMIPVGGTYTIFGDTADKVVAQLKPRMIVFPMHFRTAEAHFLPHSGEDYVKGKSNVKILDGNSFSFDPQTPPQSMQYVVLNYK